MKYKLFTMPMCPKCPVMKEFMAGQDKVEGEVVDAGKPEGMAEAREFKVASVPMVVFVDDSGTEVKRASSKEEVEEILNGI